MSVRALFLFCLVFRSLCFLLSVLLNLYYTTLQSILDISSLIHTTLFCSLFLWTHTPMPTLPIPQSSRFPALRELTPSSSSLHLYLHLFIRSPTLPSSPPHHSTELAAREHMLDHGQLGPPTPAYTYGLSPVSSRRPSMNQEPSRRPSMSLAMSAVTPASATIKEEGTDRDDSGGKGREEGTGMRPLAPLNPMSPASRRGSAAAATSRRPSAGALGMTPMTPLSSSTTAGVQAGGGLTRAKSLGSGGGGGGTGSRRSSGLAFEGTGVLSGLAASMAMSALEDEEGEELPSAVDGSHAKKTSRSGSSSGSNAVQRRKSSGAGQGEGRPRIGTGFFGAALSMSAVESDDDEDVEMAPPGEAHPASRRIANANASRSTNGARTGTSSSSTSTTRPDVPTPMTVDLDNTNGTTPAQSQSNPSTTSAPASSTSTKPNRPPSIPLPGPGSAPVSTSAPALQSPADLAAQLYANPKLAALRSPTIGRAMSPGGGARERERERERMPVSPPILMNNKCSGYFVEPVRILLPLIPPLSSLYFLPVPPPIFSPYFRPG